MHSSHGPQRFPQAPQLLGSDEVSMQPSGQHCSPEAQQIELSPAFMHWVSSAAQQPLGFGWQAPPMHSSQGSQARPQNPQLFGSV
jgi:hypothetical protein